jgi:hypothetical protein
MPWVDAVANWSAEVVAAIALCGDWTRAFAAYDVMVDAQIRFAAAAIAASSGAATELDFYGGEA